MSDPSGAMVKITADFSEVKRFFADWESRIPLIHKTALKRMGEEIVRLIKQSYLTGDPLHVRTGRLRASIDYKFSGTSTIHVGSNVVYAAIHEYGGTITPKNAAFLTIPLSRTAERIVGGAKAMQGLFVWAPGGWGSTAFLALAGRSALSLQYMLVRSVTIPARPYINPAIRQYVDAGRADNAVRWAIRTLIRKWTEGVGGA